MGEETAESETKRLKLSETTPEPEVKHCQHWVVRKKRFCKMTVGKNKKFCGEHSTQSEPDTITTRIPCPLDAKHTVDPRNLEKHLKICNARQPDEIPPYIKTGCNLGDPEPSEEAVFKLQDIPKTELDSITTKIEELFEKFVSGTIEQAVRDHEVLSDELAKESYGSEKRRHIQQTSSILGIMEHEGFLERKTCFVEFGAGKAAVSFWLATAIRDKVEDSKVLVVDRASHRHKKDNLIRDKELVDRIRADIADLDLACLPNLEKCEAFSGVSKHLCGAATDLTLRCIVQGNVAAKKTQSFIICVCCHHRCTWGTFVGKSWFLENGIDQKIFNIIIKMVSWSICGDGRNREKRETPFDKESERARKEEIGWKCKRLIDFARLQYMSSNNYETKMSFYAEKSTTLENVCLIGKFKNFKDE